jgi:hypothetical protein
MDIVECYGACTAARSLEFKVGAPSLTCPSIPAWVEVSIRSSRLVICVTDAITRIVVSAGVLELVIARGALNYREVVIPGIGMEVNIYPRAAAPCV